MIGALARDGVLARMSIAAATSTAVLQAFVGQVLAPAPRERPDAVAVMDNLAAHKAAAVRAALAAADIDHRYLPACSPDPWRAAFSTLIEPCWSKLKARLRAKAARTLDAPEAELGPALATVTAQDAQGWFRLCGYGASK